MTELDLFYYLLNPNAGEIPGLLVTLPGKRPARGRADDRLVAYLHLAGSASMSAEKQKEIVQEAARLYFETPGTVTSGLRLVFEQINRLFLDHNLRGARGGDQWIASMNIAVLRRGFLYAAQAGSLHTLVLGEQVEVFHDGLSDGRGLGINRNVTLRFFQAEIHSGDNLVMCAQLPASWSGEALANSRQIPLDALRRRLLNQTGVTFNALVMRFQNGKGLVHRLRLREAGLSIPQAVETAPTPAAAVVPEPTAPIEQPPAGQTLLEEPVLMTEEIVPPALQEPAAEFMNEASDQPVSMEQPSPEAVEAPAPAAQPARKVARPAPPRSQPIRKHVGRVWFGWQNLKKRTGSGFSRFFARLLPNAAENSPRIAPGLMLFIAIAIPLIVVGVTAAIYIRNGLSQQHTYSLQVAQQKAAEAIAQTDPLLQYQGWKEVLTQLDKADQFGMTDESRSLRAQAYTEIDRIDKVTRVELVPFSGNNDLEDMRISQIAASSTDVYLLDAAANRVERLVLVSQGTRYNQDTQFQCSGARGTGMGGLVDMVIFPNFESYKSALLAVDSGGGLIVCVAGQNARYRALPSPIPEAGFGKISALAYDQGVLYVLDAGDGQQMIWRYVLAEKDRPEEESTWAEPQAFFSEDPPDLQDVIDITVYDNQLYMLFKDGSVTQCIYDVYTQTPASCKRTISYTDLRTGQSNLPFGFSGLQLTQLQAIQPPDASVYLLDAQGPGLYHFGLGLETLNRVFRPRLNTEYALPENALTAFAVSQGTPRMVILAFVNQIYYGSLVY